MAVPRTGPDGAGVVEIVRREQQTVGGSRGCGGDCVPKTTEVFELGGVRCMNRKPLMSRSTSTRHPSRT
jgi:hypothetical protein